MDTLLRIVMLIFVICVCAFIAYSYRDIRTSKDEDRFLDFDPDGCIDAMIDNISQHPNLKALPRESVYDIVKQMMTFDSSRILNANGVDVNTLPSSIKNILPKIQLTDLISEFKRNVVIDERGNKAYLNECVVPLTSVNRFRNQTNSEKVQVKNVTSNSVQESTPTSIFYNNSNKQCKIGNVTLTTNIPKGVGTDNDIQGMISANPRNTGVQTYGCILPLDSNYINSDKFLNDLTEMYSYSDIATMGVLRNAITAYGTAVKENSTAQTNNANASLANSEASAKRASQEATQALAAKTRISNEQTAASTKATADTAATTFGSANAITAKAVDFLVA